MRIIRVWITALVLLFTVTTTWYVTLPAILGVAVGLEGHYGVMGANIATAVKYVSYAWGALLDIFVLLWAVISSQMRDVESEVYR